MEEPKTRASKANVQAICGACDTPSTYDEGKPRQSGQFRRAWKCPRVVPKRPV